MGTVRIAESSRRTQPPIGIVTCCLALIVGGLWTGSQLPLEWVPTVALPSLTVTASWPGASPRAVEKYVTSPIERVLQGTRGTMGVESFSRPAASSVRLKFSAASDMRILRAEVEDRLARLRHALPAGVVPRLEQDLPEELREEQGFMTLQVVGSMAPERLRQLTEGYLVPRLRSLPDIAGVSVAGGRTQELLVKVDPGRLRAYSVTFETVGERLGGALLGQAYGYLRGSGQAVYVLSAAEENLASLRRLPLVTSGLGPKVVRLGDVAEMGLGLAPVTTISRIDGKPVVALILDRTADSNLLRVADTVRREVSAFYRNGVCDEVDILFTDDRSKQVREQLRDLALQGSVGIILMIAFLALVLRSLQAVAVVIFSIILSLAVSVILMAPFGVTLNIITLAGLALMVGLLVDNAIVVVDTLITGRDRSGSRTAAGRNLRHIWLPLLGGTLTSIVVFLPMVYLSQSVRVLFSSFAVLVALTLASSLVITLFLVPRLESWMPRRRCSRSSLAFRWRAASRCILSSISRYPRMTLAILLLVFGLPIGILPDRWERPVGGWSSHFYETMATVYNATLGSEAGRQLRDVLEPVVGGVMQVFLDHAAFFDGWAFDEEPTIYVQLDLPPGSVIGRADELIRRFETVALRSPASRKTFVRVGENSAFLSARFHKQSMHTYEPFSVRNAFIQEAAGLAGIDVSIWGLTPQGYYSGMGNVLSLVVAATGPSYEGLQRVIDDMAARLERDPRVSGVDTHSSRSSRTSASEVVRFRWPSEATIRTGFRGRDVAAMLRPRLFSSAASFRADIGSHPQIPVRIVQRGSESEDVADLLDTSLANEHGIIKLGMAAEYTLEQQPPVIARHDQRYVRYIRVFYRGPVHTGRTHLQKILQSIALPFGYDLKVLRLSFLTDDVRNEFVIFIGTILCLVFLVLAAVLESWTLPWVVMLSVPMAFVGVAVGFLATGANFAEGAFIGLVLLIGVSTNNSLLLVDGFCQLRNRRRGDTPAMLVRLTLRRRVRAMWTTTLSSVAGMLPLLFFPDVGDFWFGLAITVTGGLLSSTLLAPVATIALLSWVKEASPPERPPDRARTVSGDATPRAEASPARRAFTQARPEWT